MSDHSHFPNSEFARLGSILAPKGPIPVSKSTWWAGVKSGRFPRPVKLGPRITAWRVEDRAATGYSEPTIYRKMAAGTFPKGVKIDPNSRAVIWWEDEIIAYQKAAIHAAEQAA